MCALMGLCHPLANSLFMCVCVCVCAGLILIPRRICWAGIVAELCHGLPGACWFLYCFFRSFPFLFCLLSLPTVRASVRLMHDKRAMLLQIFGTGMFAQLFADNPVLLFNKSCLPSPPFPCAPSAVSGSLAYWQDAPQSPQRLVPAWACLSAGKSMKKWKCLCLH